MKHDGRPSGDAEPAARERRWYRGRLWALAAAVALVAIVVYLPALGNGFTNWDDTGYVVENPHLGRLDGGFLAWAFTTFQQGNWHPLTWLSLGVDHAIFGLAPFGYHLCNVLLHAVAALLVVQLMGALFARARGARDRQGLLAAALVGMLFAVHPLHVESVAWVSERKDLLCGVFYVLALLAYLGFAENRRRGLYLASLGAFGLALMAKPMAVSLPLVLLVLDAYPLGRLTRSGWKRVVVEKVPFLALTLASIVLTMAAQSGAGAVLAVSYVSVGSRLWSAERALGFYLAKTVLPIDLVPVYPLEHGVSPWRWDFLLSLALVLGTSAVAVVVRRCAPLLGALWASFLVMLLPVLGLVQVGEQAAADRYMYLPLLAPAIGIAAVSLRVWQAGPRARAALTVTVLVALAGLSILTVRQIGVWRDTPTLWTWVIAKQPRVAVAHYNLGEYRRKQGDWNAAERCWKRAAEIEPTFSWPLSQLGNLAVQRGEIDEARRYYEQATRANVRDVVAQYNYAGFLEDQGQFAEARVHYEIFLRFAPPKYADQLAEVRARLSTLPARP